MQCFSRLMIRIAILGFGNVGRALVRHLNKGLLNERGKILVIGVADVSGALLLNSPDEIRVLRERVQEGRLLRDCAPRDSLMKVCDFLRSLPSAACDVLVECMPTNLTDGEPALSHLKAVLEEGISVVTVDKGPLVHGFAELSQAARRGRSRIAYGGTTGVRPPPEIGGADIQEVNGILNGTTNFVLTEMLENSITFDQALAAAKDKGIAETDSSLDIGGWDTSCKILILANEWMQAGAGLSDVARRGIGPETDALVCQARRSGAVVRLLARASKQEDRIGISVSPEIVGTESPFYPISGMAKGALFTTTDGGEFFSAGRSGLDSISQIILEDMHAVVRGE